MVGKLPKELGEAESLLADTGYFSKTLDNEYWK